MHVYREWAWRGRIEKETELVREERQKTEEGWRNKGREKQRTQTQKLFFFSPKVCLNKQDATTTKQKNK